MQKIVGKFTKQILIPFVILYLGSAVLADFSGSSLFAQQLPKMEEPDLSNMEADEEIEQIGERCNQSLANLAVIVDINNINGLIYDNPEAIVTQLQDYCEQQTTENNIEPADTENILLECPIDELGLGNIVFFKESTARGFSGAIEIDQFCIDEYKSLITGKFGEPADFSNEYITGWQWQIEQIEGVNNSEAVVENINTNNDADSIVTQKIGLLLANNIDDGSSEDGVLALYFGEIAFPAANTTESEN